LGGAFDGLQLDSQVVGEALNQFVVVQVGRLSGLKGSKTLIHAQE
jgi:hypothetical protein